jgi:hypothetical protein
MSLDEFLANNPQVAVVRRVPGGPVYVANSAPAELFHLTDYVVSSQCAGCYILVVRRF